MALARDGKIELADAGASTNQISITLGRFAPLCTEKEHGGQRKRPLPFTVKHAAGQSSKPQQNDSTSEGKWVIVTHRKKKSEPVRHPMHTVQSWVAKTSANGHARRSKMKGHVKQPRAPVPLAQYMPKGFNLQGAGNISSCLNTNDKQVDAGECSSPKHTEDEEVQMHRAASYSAEITFKDEDLLLGGAPHNRPMFVEGYTRGQKLKRILVDQGSAVNILSLRALKNLGGSSDELAQSRLMIQGFNQGWQRAIGIINLNLRVGGLSSSVVCHVIEARTSYNLLLGRPWIHENGVVPSSWHQCFMYEKNGVTEKVVADESPFAEAESYFADAKFYIRKQVFVEEAQKSNDNPHSQLKSKGKEVVEVDQHPTKLIFPLARIDTLKIDEADQVLPTKRTEGFDPNAYKLLAKAGYNPNEPRKLGKLIPEAGGKGKANQQEPHERKGLGYVPPKPVRIFINRAASNCISTDESEYDPQLDPAKGKKKSVFKRMGKVESQRSVFDRLGSNPKTSKRKSIHDRLGTVQDVKNNASHHAEVGSSKRLRSMIPSRMRRETDIHISCGEVLKVQPRTIVHTRVQKGENEESVGSSDDVVPPQDEEASSFHITLCDETPIEGEDAEEAPHELEEGVRAAIDELKEVDLGTPENPRPIFISTLLSNEDEEIYVTLLKEYIDVFAWTYKEMPGLDPKVAVHRLAVKKTCRPVKQAQRRFRPELIPSIEGEVNKLIEVGFIREVKYPTWISSIVPVRKKNGQIRVCVDFRDLNVACPKDDFPLPITELMIDAVTGHEIMSFMDGSSGYNQIRMAPEDEELTAFRTPKGIYCYKVIPFGLKNAGATYQRAMQTIFDDMLHKMVECYVDDLVVKSKLRADHLGHLRKVFDRLRKFQLKMNPLKCAFGVAAGKFLGFTVRHRGIEIE
ncbi:uncharacterized protein LOC116029639 [Ipomoea triloba]|uniref:uncharacterized protein LOC116029639 n=1 Tax=Ipomoea triloba TaxID=35885 RepID=UPI00125D69D3|nr:uncharacterized protein LOC116029639 [Ipomoea triloba]